MKKHLTQLKLTEAYNNVRFKGQYFLTGFVVKVNDKGESYIEITLSDATDSLTLYCRDQSCILSDLQPESLVDVEAQLDISGKAPYFRCKFIQSSSVGIDTPRTLTQLPSARCASPESLHMLIELVDSIRDVYLRDFVLNVLLKSNIGFRYIQCPASLNHHHNYRSGLLVHSVEMGVAAAKDNSLAKDERDLAIVAALLHDIGKTMTMTPDMTRTDIGYSVDHDQLTLEICADALRILEVSNKGYARHLRHVWTCASEGSRYGFKAKTKVAKLLKQYDRDSACLIAN